MLGNRFNQGTTHYVNDASTVGGALTTASGSDANSGLTPAAPKASIAGVFSDAGNPVHASDVIELDTGSFAGFALTASADGVFILGSPNGPAVITGPVTITGVSNLTLENIVFQGTVTLTDCTAVALTDDVLGAGISIAGGANDEIVHTTITAAAAGAGVAFVNDAGNAGPIGAEIENDVITGGATGIAVSGAGIAGMIVQSDRLAGSATGISLTNATAGLIDDNDVSAVSTGLLLQAAFSGSITGNEFYGATVGVAYSADAALGANRIHDNTIGISSTVASGPSSLGADGSVLPNQISQNGTGVHLTNAAMQNQHIYDNGVGVSGSGTLGGTDLALANLIEANAVTVNFSGTIQYNKITRETVGINAQNGQLIAYNVLYGNTQANIVVNGVTAVQIVNNTLYASTGDNIDITGSAAETDVLNNILWAHAGYDINVANNSQSGFFSDFNDLYADGTGKLVHWDIDFTDILDWQDDVAQFDLHSEGSTVLNPALNRPRFAALSLNDFQVVNVFAGLRSSSPTINAADPITDEALPASSQNLLSNPGFEAGLTGWTALPSGSTQSANPAPWQGSSYFFAGVNAVVTLDQTVNLTASGITDAQIDAGNQILVFGGRVRSANETPADSGAISLTFYDGSGNVLSTVTDNADNLSTRWELVGSRVAIPAGARTARFRFTAVRNTGTTNDSYLDGAFVFVQGDALALDQGAYETAGAQSAAAQAPLLRLISPDLYVDWLDNVPVPIKWESLGNTANLPVRIDLYQDGPNGPQFLLNITPSTADTGEYDWIAADSGIGYGTHGLRIEISLVGMPNVFDRSTEDFTVPENTNTFYVNDAGTFGDQYTTAPGSNRNDGRIASEPVPYPNNILRTYTLGPTDTLYVDTGTYALLTPIVLSAITGIGDDSAFTWTGPTNGLPATLAFANPLTVAPVVTLDDAGFMTIEDMTLQGGQDGMLVENNSTNLDADYLTFTHNTGDGLLVQNSPNVTLDHLSASHNGQAGIQIQSGSNVLDMGFITAFANGGDGIYDDGLIPRLYNSSATFNGSDGIHLSDVGGVLVQADTASNNGGDGIYVSQTGAVQAIVGSLVLTQNLGNIVANNSGDGIQTYGNVLTAGNVVSGSSGSGAAGVYLNGAGAIADNDIFNNNNGVLLLGNASVPVFGNRIYHNVNDGIAADHNSPLYDNIVYSNGVGILLGTSYSGEVNNNLIYGNTFQGILVQATAGAGTQIVNNTIYEPVGDGIDIQQHSSNVQLRNDIIWTQAGYDISVASDSQTGFASDFNILYTSGTGQVGLWQQIARPTMQLWRNADFTDADSLFANPLFVNVLGADGNLGYVSQASDGRDDDFHEQSQQGSFHGGALAPVVSAATGLPMMPTAVQTIDANESPAIDRGATTDSFANEPAPNGGYVNIGAFGNTAQASLSRLQYLFVTRPTGGEVWPEQQTFSITWRFALAPVGGVTPPAGTVDINLLVVGNSTPVLNIASGVPNNGQFSWTLPSTIAPGTTYLIQIVSDQYAGLTAGSPQPFTIPAPVHVYYINDGSVSPGDWTTAPGSDSNDGLTPNTPKASITGVLAAYHLNSGDTIMVDAGTYNLNNILVLNAAASGIIIEGYNNGANAGAAAVFSRGLSSSDVIDVSGATNLTLEYLTVTGGAIGISALDGTGSTGLTIANCTVFGNNSTGIYVGTGDNNANITDNLVYGLPHDSSSTNDQATGISIGNGAVSGVTVSGNTVHDAASYGINLAGATFSDTISNNEVYDCGYGIMANNNATGLANLTTVKGNTIHDNGTGIYNTGDVLTTQNVVFNQTSWGIYVSGGVYEVLGNTVHDNAIGIFSFSNSSVLIQGNTVYHNTSDGIEAEGTTTVNGNTIYGNAVGVAADYGNYSIPLVGNNLIYENTSQGILVTGSDSGVYFNNTIYQPTGDAIDVVNGDKNVMLKNNILWAQAGFDIKVDSTSEVGFQSDYNDLYTTGTGSIGSWEGQSFTSLASWILELNLDHHSLSANPQFVNPAGPDGILGYGTTPIGAAQVIDDSSSTGFAKVGAWTTVTNAAADNGKYITAPAGTGSSTATWTFTGLIPGATYQVSASWVGSGALASDAPFTVFDGNQEISVAHRAENSSPGGAGTPSYQTLGYFVSASGTLTVELTNAARNTVAADSVMLQQIQGNGGADDDFQLSPGSPAVDAGNPADPVGQEPTPNGGRIDQGAYGGTSQATPSPQQEVQVLNPAGLDKLQPAQQVSITWRTNGIDAPAGTYSNAVLAANPLAYYRLDDASGSAAVDSSGNALNASYVGGVQLGQPGALPFDPDTAVTLDGSTGYVQLPTISNDFTHGFSAEVWVYPTAVVNGEAFIDLGTSSSYLDAIELYRSGTSNDLAFQVYQGSSNGKVVTASNAITLNQWQYFAVTMDAAGNVTLCKNGAVIATGTTYVPRAGIVRADNYLGKNGTGGYPLFAGGLDEAAIYAAPLSAAQIQASYAQIVYGTVNIDLLQAGTVVQNIAANVPDNFSYTWTIPANVPVGNGYQVRVTANNSSQPSGVSSQPFLITNSGSDYYIAVNGNDANSGKDPADPMASLAALLTAYSIGPGDTIHVGPGSYTLLKTIVLNSSDNGFTITGPTSGAPAIITRNNSTLDVLDVAGATNVTLEYLSITGGAIGIDLLDSTDSLNVTVSHCTVFGNNNIGIYIGVTDDFAQILDNTVYGLPHNSSNTDNQPIGIESTAANDIAFAGAVVVSGNTVYNSSSYGIYFYSFGAGPSILDNEVFDCGDGLYVGSNTSGAADRMTVSGNTVFDNATGIVITANVIVVQNLVYGQSGIGISVPDGGYEVLDNTVYNNATGIYAYSSGGAIEDNSVYFNSGDGIIAERNTPVLGNTVYGNATGLALDYSSLGPVTNNVIYENTTQGILISSSSSPIISNNTVYQPVGDAIDVQSSAINVVLKNNILWTQAGFDINVDPTSEVGFQSDFNDLYTTGSGKLGRWQGQTFLTQQNWYYGVGQDHHSLSTDPQFAAPAAGLDGILGYNTTPIGAPLLIDDSSATGFSTTGVWTPVVASAADNGEYLTAPAGTGSSTATWTFTGLTPGTTYQVSASWAPLSTLAADAPFTIFDGGREVSLTYHTERSSPGSAGTPSFQTLADVVCTSGTLTVELTNAAQSTVAADAIRLQQIQGNGGADDAFHVALGSPTIDAGNPTDPIGQEPAPNGGRINLGSDGGTPQATASASESLTVLTPGPLDKLQIGQQENITWQTGGLYAPADYYAGTILADNPLAYYRLDDASGSTAVDSSSNGMNATYVGGVQLGQPGALPFDPDTAVTLDGSTGYVQLPTINNDFTHGFSAEVWVYPTAVASNATFIDLGNSSNGDAIILYRSGTSNDLAFQVFQGGNSGKVVTASNAITLNQWQYFAVTMDANGNVTLYKNGVVIATGTTYTPRAGIVRADNYLGKNGSSPNNPLYAGSLDEAAIYTKQLSAAQIQAHYAQLVFGTVNIDLLQNGVLVQNIAAGVPDNGSYAWTVPANVTLEAGYQVRVTANDGTQPSGASAQSFLIADSGDNFYVNDGSTTGDVYTTAVGNDANSGADPADPMATLAALLQAYPLGSGDTIYLDTGNYTVLRNVMLDAAESGVTIVGPTTGPGAVLNRGNTNPGSYDFQMLGAVNDTLSYLTITGGLDGIFGSNTADSTGLTVTNSTIIGNVSYGIFLDVGNDRATFADNVVYGDQANGNKQVNGIFLNTDTNTITGNTVYDHAGTGIYDSDNPGMVGGIAIDNNLVYGNTTGINLGTEYATSTFPNTVSNNIVRNNTSVGIAASKDVIVSDNTIFGQSATNAVGVNVTDFGGAIIENNIIYGNYFGIQTEYGDSILNNRLYNNTNAAINTAGNEPVMGNLVYSNNIGIELTYDFDGTLSDNLIYANTTDGILLNENGNFGGGLIVNNTVYQVSGNAVALQGGTRNIELRNNILWVLAGYDINIAAGSQTGFNSDDNDLYIGAGANVGSYNSANETQLSNWQTATTQDAHSLSANPDFVNLVGADDLLGYTQVNGVYADYGEDDNFTLSAGSPAIDRGDSWTAPLTDLTGAARQDDPGTANQGSPDYFPAPANPQPAYPNSGTLLNFGVNNFSFKYTLPFSFTFYGQTYTNVFLATDGFLQFAGPDNPADGTNPAAKLLSDTRIAPLWATLTTTQAGDGVFADTSVANQVTFRWVATNPANNSPVNFAVTLYKTGSIQFYYGSGNTGLSSPTVGISAGNGTTYQLLTGYAGQTSLTNAASVVYSLQPGIVDLGAYEFRGSSLDTTPPTVTSVSPAVIASGSVGFSFTQLRVTFSKPVNPIDAGSSAVYELRKAGSNGFGSTDDVIYSLTPTYNAATNTVTLTVNGLGNGALPAGNYRFTIFSVGADTIHDLSGNALDGDGDGSAGGSFVQTFTLTGAPPTVIGISPAAGPLSGGTTVTISGTNLTGITMVQFGGAAAVPVLTNNGTQITATSPLGSAGPVAVTLIASGGTAPAGSFTYLAAPTVTGIAASAGPVAGGTSITITGTGLLNASAVDFGMLTGVITSKTATQIVATSPAEAAGTVDVTVTTGGGVSGTSPADQFTFEGVPTVTGVSPAIGPTVGGASVVISGTNLLNALHVYFGAVPAVITQDTDTQITATSTTGASFTRVDITVVTAGGTSATSPLDQFTFVTEPTVQSLSATQGPIAGGTTVTITGTDLAGGNTVVNFGTNPGAILSNTGTQIIVTSPAASTAGPVDVTVVTAGGPTPINRPADQFTYTQFSATVTVASSLNASVFGQPVTFSATITPLAQGLPAPNGTANLVIDGSVVQSAVPVSNGQVAFAPMSSLAVTPTTPYSVQVVYNGDINYANASNILLGGQGVDQADAPTILTPSANPALLGKSITLTAVVQFGAQGPGSLLGTVTFLDGTAVLGMAAVQDSNGTFAATLTTSALVQGRQTLSATYNGNDDFSVSSSATLVEIVDNSQISLVSSADPAQGSKAVTITATVSATVAGAGTPTGTVTILDGTTVLGTPKLSAGKATFTSSTLALGSHSITADYNGDTNFTSVASGVLSEPVLTTVPVPTTTTLTGPATAPAAGQAITLTATVKAGSGGGTPTGHGNLHGRRAVILGTKSLNAATPDQAAADRRAAHGRPPFPQGDLQRRSSVPGEHLGDPDAVGRQGKHGDGRRPQRFLGQPVRIRRAGHLHSDGLGLGPRRRNADGEGDVPEWDRVSGDGNAQRRRPGDADDDGVASGNPYHQGDLRRRRQFCRQHVARRQPDRQQGDHGGNADLEFRHLHRRRNCDVHGEGPDHRIGGGDPVRPGDVQGRHDHPGDDEFERGRPGNLHDQNPEGRQPCNHRRLRPGRDLQLRGQPVGQHQPGDPVCRRRADDNHAGRAAARTRGRSIDHADGHGQGRRRHADRHGDLPRRQQHPGERALEREWHAGSGHAQRVPGDRRQPFPDGVLQRRHAVPRQHLREADAGGDQGGNDDSGQRAGQCVGLRPTDHLHGDGRRHESGSGQTDGKSCVLPRRQRDPRSNGQSPGRQRRRSGRLHAGDAAEAGAAHHEGRLHRRRQLHQQRQQGRSLDANGERRRHRDRNQLARRSRRPAPPNDDAAGNGPRRRARHRNPDGNGHLLCRADQTWRRHPQEGQRRRPGRLDHRLARRQRQHHGSLRRRRPATVPGQHLGPACII